MNGGLKKKSGSKLPQSMVYDRIKYTKIISRVKGNFAGVLAGW